VDLLSHLLIQHGYLFVFAYVFLVQAGLPVPADPMLLVMGTMVGEGRYGMALAILTGVSAASLGDLMWYELGRHRGNSILRLLCRLTIEPDTCVRKTEDSFGKRGARTLLLAKFVPGLSLVSVPMAGVIRMPRWRFLMFDVIGATLWVTAYLTLGVIFKHQVQMVIDFLGNLGHYASLLLLTALALYLGFKYYQRWRFLRAFRIGRVNPKALREMLEGPVPVTVIDLRHPHEVEREGVKLAGALLMRPEDLRSRSGEIPKDQEIILYCT
jgi:membrane protein DedA with SNARE-associated domain